MAISAYVGVPGSGKSYEVVKSVILPAYLAGRRIVTNIEGINEDKFKEYAIKFKKANESDLGSIIHVSDSDMMKDDFFPFKNKDESNGSVCKAGDLIAIDELWRIWGSDSKIPENHRSFIAEHRHEIDAKTGLSCDLVVINQSVSNIPRFVKDRIEQTYSMTKLKSLGLTSRYRVDVYNGSKLYKTNKVTSYQEGYKKSIFNLYKSYNGTNGKEVSTDKRQNIFAKKSLWFFILFFIIMTFLSIRFILHFFTTPYASVSPTAIDTPTVASISATQKSAPVKPKISTTWRIAGKIKQNGKSLTILISNQGAIRLEPSSQFIFAGLMKQGEFNGEIVTKYSGSGAGQ